MAKDRKKLQHIHSSIADKQPTATSLEVGEIAVNNAKDQEFLSVKNSDNKVVRFSSDGQIIEWMERKEVMPYVGYVRGGEGPSATSAATPTADSRGSYGIQENDLINNTSEIIIKLNQVAASATTKHDRVNGANDKYNKKVNPTTDGGVTDGAGFFIDMSRYAMQDANPSFSGITNTCYTTLNGTTKIKGAEGDCGSLLEVTVNTFSGDIETANTQITSAKTEIGTNETTISGNTTLNVSGTTTETKKGDVTENNLSAKTENTSGNFTVNTGGNVVTNTAGTTTETKKGDVIENNNANKTENTSGNTVMTSTGNTCITSLADASFYGSANTKVGVACNGDITERAEMQGEDVVINATTNNVGITAKNELDASAEGSINITANDSICETAGVNASFYAVEKTNIGLNCDDTTSSTTTNVYGETINENASTANTTIGDATTVITNDNTTIGTEVLHITGTTTITRDGSVTENNKNGYTATTTGTVCEHSSVDMNLGGDNNTRIGYNCAGTSGYSNNTYISASSSAITYAPNILESGTTVNITGGTSVTVSGGSSANTYAPTINISGGNITEISTGKTCITAGSDLNMGGDANTRIGANCEGTSGYSNNTYITASSSAITYAPNIEISGNTTNITGATNVNIKGGDVCISGNTEASMGAKDVKIGTDCGGTTIATGITINASTAVTINAPTTNITGNTNISGNTVIGGDTYISGDTKIGGDLVIDIPCDTITSTTVNDALCEILERGEVTWKASGYSASDENLKWYELYQNGAQIKDQNGNPVRIDIPKDHILKDAEVVYGKASGSAFTACTEAVEDCHWYIKLTWNVFTPAGHTDDKIVYIPADEFVTDIAAKNPNGVVADSYNNVFVNVWYENGKNWVSATTTPTIHVTQNLYADGTVSGATVSGTTGKFTTLSAGTTTISGVTTINNNLNVTGNTNITGTTNISGATKIDDKLTVTDVLDAQKGLSKTLKYSHNGFSGETNFSGDTTFNSPHSALTIQYGTTVSGWTSADTYDTSAAKTVHIPTCVDDLGRAKLTWEYGDVHTSTSKTYDPGANCTNTAIADKVTIPNSLKHLTEWNNGCLEVDGCVKATAVYATSDERLKENIEDADFYKAFDAHNIRIKSFNFISDESKRKTYGVIAQDLIAHNLPEIVHTDENGMHSVDYTSLMLLKIKFLENEVELLKHRLELLERKDK